jgi:hypothetical protein
MYLNGALCKVVDEDERRRLGHNLKTIWKRFKREFADPELNKFDQAISELDQYARIRYPEEILSTGLGSTIGFVRNTSSATHRLVVDELDAIAKAIFEKAGLNAKAFTDTLFPKALEYLRDQNKSSLS